MFTMYYDLLILCMVSLNVTKRGLTFLVFFERKIHFEKTEFKFIMFHINLWMLTDQKSFSIHVFAFQKNLCCE